MPFMESRFGQKSLIDEEKERKQRERGENRVIISESRHRESRERKWGSGRSGGVEGW